MSQVALYIGIKNGIRQLIEEGDPRDIRHKFKHSDGEGFEALEVFESTVGRSRRRVFVKDSPVPVATILPPLEPPVEDEPPAEPVAANETETLITLAQGDGRRADVKEAREKLDEIGIAY